MPPCSPSRSSSASSSRSRGRVTRSTGNTLLFFLIVGVTYGSVYAVAAVGLVVTYTTSGIFNFAQGAIGMFMAFVFWQLHDPTDGWGIQTLVALLLTVLVAAPLLGRGSNGS